MSKVLKNIEDNNFSYFSPWFYNNNMALRCELGFGKTDTEYLDNAYKQAIEIFNILFNGFIDAVFFDISTYENGIISCNPSKEKEANEYNDFQNHYPYKIISNIGFDKEEYEGVIQINRIIGYVDGEYDYKKQIKKYIRNQDNVCMHFVSNANECIMSIYDDRGCDIVFFDEEKFIKFYPLLQPYFLEYDKKSMEDRFVTIKNKLQT